MTSRELSRKLGWSHATISFIESGSRPPTPFDVATYLGGCGPVKKADYEWLVQLASEPDDSSLTLPNGPELRQELRSLIVQESLAHTIDCYEPRVVPGLLQSESYIRELLSLFSSVSAEVREVRVQARLARQGLLHRAKPPQCTFFIQENALRTTIGTASIMNEQILYLMLTGSQKHCTLRVVPDSAGPFSALNTLRLMDYEKHPSVGYTEGQGVGIFVEKPSDIVAYRTILSKLDHAALDEEESRAWLADLAGAYDRAEAAPSCPPPTSPG
ncbi:helix-turn-helix transcriptional regulator [Amycolatopsis minnesotensis]|uniref:Helix-turn-helix transcriptional regulator n=2 Tax=Amycolatopsis minnesotensis TaxID=337894 RepID=A0ABN2RA91_9PSEU